MSRHSRPFYPPKLNPPLVRLLQTLGPTVVRWTHQLELIISTESDVQLSTLQNQPCLLLCNHPTFHDPIVLFLFSARLGKPFYYLAAHEQFSGIQGQLYQRLGAYSVRRGQPDRASVAQTFQVLAQPDSKLVIFPEGGCSFQNDTVMPFRPGAVQMALQSLAKQARAGTASDLLVVPMSLKYRYTRSMTAVIEQTLSQLEQATGASGIGNSYQRLREVSGRVIRQCELEYGLTPPPTADWNQRITNIKTEILQQCEQRLGVTPIPGIANRERVYHMQQLLEDRYSVFLADGTDSWEVLHKALGRVLNFDAIYDGYVAEKPTPERFLDTLIRLEREVFNIDQPTPKGYRQAFLRVGTPVPLKPYLNDYAKNRTATVKTLVHELQQTVQTNLNLLSEATARGISW
ncbi:MAG: 1-acyl-sn-glycerol-3-phosphate acyltransferase [Synechococcales cyanobacterium M58_A2018_015]|nr:1-acyl-sn-glycerol-3-phosphate acyltransferase [Synechococcales cyanobacterium M58_A2018_015]